MTEPDYREMFYEGLDLQEVCAMVCRDLALLQDVIARVNKQMTLLHGTDRVLHRLEEMRRILTEVVLYTEEDIERVRLELERDEA